jgi:xylulose-5-phosphate/fructose-6-phosphate phosphoketolase
MRASAQELEALDAWWRAANYLTLGQIYLQDNPLLRDPLRPSHIKPRLLGHWGTAPGLNLVYAHVNRAIRLRGLDGIFLAGPGHGAPAVLANAYLEGTYSEIYPHVTLDLAGMRALFRQFATPGGVPSHVGPQTPGSIHEGGELGYVLAHAFGAAFDDPELLAIAVVGDGEAETGPLEGTWKGISYLHPARDGAVLPVLHLNGYKVSGPTVLGRSSDADVKKLLEGHGYAPRFVTCDEPAAVHRAFADTLDDCLDAIAEIQHAARSGTTIAVRPRWPAIVLRTPDGWTGPREIDGRRMEGTHRMHQVPMNSVRANREHLDILETWMKSYRPDELFDAAGRPIAALTALAPAGERRMSASARTRGARTRELAVPDIEAYAIDVVRRGTARHESTRRLGEMIRDVYRANPTSFRLMCPDETSSNRLDAVFEVTDRCLVAPRNELDVHVSPDGRVMEVLSEHCCEGWLEGYVLTGRHGVLATYETFALIVASMAIQHANWLEEHAKLAWRAPVPSLNILLTSTCWRNDHNGYSHQGPGFLDTILTKKGTVPRIFLPPDANCLLAVTERCLHSRDHVNLIVIDKQPELQWLGLAEARGHCARGASRWTWASNEHGDEPDVVLACAGDVPTLETLAAASWLRERAPELAVRVVNVVDLLALADPDAHPHGVSPERFDELFTRDRHVVFAFHGYAEAIHMLLHGRRDPSRFHVRGYCEEGTTATLFDMLVRNEISRFHLVIEALRRAHRPPSNAATLVDECRAMLDKHAAYVLAHLEDLPEIQGWLWHERG